MVILQQKSPLRVENDKNLSAELKVWRAEPLWREEGGGDFIYSAGLTSTLLPHQSVFLAQDHCQLTLLSQSSWRTQIIISYLWIINKNIFLSEET